jgi:hypothetical protein
MSRPADGVSASAVQVPLVLSLTPEECSVVVVGVISYTLREMRNVMNDW